MEYIKKQQQQNFQKVHKKIIQTQLQMKMIKKYLKKDVYLQKRQKIIDNLTLNIIV